MMVCFPQSLEAELVQQKPMVEKAKELSKKVTENTKDPGTKAELKNKMAAIEKPLQEMEKKLGNISYIIHTFYISLILREFLYFCRSK